MSLIHRNLFIILSAFIVALPAFTEKVRITGSSTVQSFLWHSYKKTIETETGIELEVTMNSSGRGLIALVNEQTDLAMSSSTLSSLISKLSKDNPQLKRINFTAHPLAHLKVEFIVHASNPINTLTAEQVIGIMTSQITAWGELGHPELGKIQVVTEDPSGGIFTFLEKKALQQQMTTNRITVPHGPQVAKIVSQLPHSFGFISQATIPEQRFGVVTVPTEFDDLQQPLFLISRDDKPLTIEQKKIIKAAQKYSAAIVGQNIGE